MDTRIKRRLDRLKHLGYSSFQIRMMIREAIGSDHTADAGSVKRRVLASLDKYERLGSAYIKTYSK